MQEITKSLEKLGIDFEELGNDIILLKNFIQKDEASLLWNIINEASQEDWEEDYRNSQIELAKVKYGRDDLDNLIAEGIAEYSDFWADKAIAIPDESAKSINERLNEIFYRIDNLNFSGMTTIHRHYEGAELREHVDSDGDPYVLYAIIGYLNDNYTEGELVFPNLNFEIVPPANSILIFPDGEMYRHGVRAPGEGPTRYSLPSFVLSDAGIEAYTNLQE